MSELQWYVNVKLTNDLINVFSLVLLFTASVAQW